MKLQQKKSGQNIIEFVFVFPILILLTLAIFEVALYWQDLNAVYSLNTEINANVALLDPTIIISGVRNRAAYTAIKMLEEKGSTISLSNPQYNVSSDDFLSFSKINNPTFVMDGTEPYALYKFTSTTTVAGKPQITLWVDCRNPFEKGVITQIEFYHKTMIMKASIPRFDSPDPIVIIPDNVFIATPKLNTIKQY